VHRWPRGASLKCWKSLLAYPRKGRRGDAENAKNGPRKNGNGPPRSHLHPAPAGGGALLEADPLPPEAPRPSFRPSPQGSGPASPTLGVQRQRLWTGRRQRPEKARAEKARPIHTGTTDPVRRDDQGLDARPQGRAPNGGILASRRIAAWRSDGRQHSFLLESTLYRRITGT
jgi:hypothetical protein